jgi:hypothetical protein
MLAAAAPLAARPLKAPRMSTALYMLLSRLKNIALDSDIVIGKPTYTANQLKKRSCSTHAKVSS